LFLCQRTDTYPSWPLPGNAQLSENRDGLKQNLKLVSFAALGIGALFIAFMASNGLI
jgi:hypothetical protein